jgi:two-component system, NarL family, response regulator NreC
MDSPIRIILAEDHHLVRHGLRLLLEQEKGFCLVAEAKDGLEAVQLTLQHKPDVLVLDLMVPRLHGLEAIRQVRRDCPRTRILVLSMHADEPYVVEAMRNGALGYVLKDGTADELVKAVRDVRAGKRYLSPALTRRTLTDHLRRSSGEIQVDLYETLTNRERLVLQLAAGGLTSSQIASRLFISPRTAETHRANFMRKLALRSQTDLVRFAIRRKIIPA